MMCMRGWKSFLVVPALLLSLAPARAAAPTNRVSPLAQVPADSPLVFYLHGAERTKDRVVALMKNALPDLAPKVEAQLNEWLKNGIVEGRLKLTGVPADGAIFVAFTEVLSPERRGPPKMAFIIQVKDYATFRDGLLSEEERKNLKGNGRGVEMTHIKGGGDIFFVEKKGYAIVTPNEDAANEFTRARPGLDTTLDKAVAARLLAGDGALYVNVASIVKTYRDQIKAAQEELEKKLDEQTEKIENPSQKASVAMFKSFAGVFFQLLHDTRSVLVTVELRPTAVVLHKEAGFKAGSPTATTLKSMKTVSFNTLNRLPAGELIYMGTESGPTLYKFLSPLTAGVLGGDAKEIKEVKEAMAELGRASAGYQVTSVSLPPRGLQVAECKDPVKFTSAQLKLLKAMTKSNSFEKVAMAKYVIEEKTQTYEGFKLHQIRTTWEYDKLSTATGGKLPEEIQKKITAVFQVLLGKEMSSWFGTDGKVFVQVTARDWATAKKVLDQYFKEENTVGATAGYRAIRKQLPAEASFLGMLDTSKATNVVLEVLKVVLPDKNIPAPKPNAAGTYIGMAVTLQSRRGSSDIVVTAPAIKAVYETAIKPLVQGSGD